MPTFLIERNIPGAATLSAGELQGIARKSCSVVDSLKAPYAWHHSYVAGDKIYCIHEAEDADIIHEHARRGGFPADHVVEVAAVIGPHTADA
jgi:hypothetical protein